MSYVVRREQVHEKLSGYLAGPGFPDLPSHQVIPITIRTQGDNAQSQLKEAGVEANHMAGDIYTARVTKAQILDLCECPFIRSMSAHALTNV